MRKKKKDRKIKKNGVCSPGETSREKFFRHCRNALLITASYQILSVCLEPTCLKEAPTGPGGGKSLLSTVAQQISAAFVTPAHAIEGVCVKYHDIPSRGGGCGGCVGCVGCIGYTGPSEYEIGRSLNSQGAAASRNGDWEKAADFYRQALTHSPNDTVIQVNLKHAEAVMAYQRGDWRHRRLISGRRPWPSGRMSGQWQLSGAISKRLCRTSRENRSAGKRRPRDSNYGPRCNASRRRKDITRKATSIL